MDVKVREKKITCKGAPPKFVTGATAAAPAATVGYVNAIAESTRLVKK